jgi:hypothetical protein
MRGAYFITDGLGRVKIGSAANVEARFKRLKKEYLPRGARLELVRIIEREEHPDEFFLERWLQKKYRGVRQLGLWPKPGESRRTGTREWFTYSEDMMTVQPPSRDEIYDLLQKDWLARS